MASLGTKKEILSTTKVDAADRLYIVWLGYAKRVRDLGLAGLKVESKSEKDFAALGEEMKKTKKAADWVWEFDYDAFAFEFRLMIGSKKTLLANASMSSIGDMGRRREILESMRGKTSTVTQSDIDKDFKDADARAAKGSDVKKIDDEIAKFELDIGMYEKALRIGPKKSDDLKPQEIRLDLMDFAKGLSKSAYAHAHFMLGADLEWTAFALMKNHFVKGAPEPVSAVPAPMIEQLVKEWDNDKGKPDFKKARKLVGTWVDKNVMPKLLKERLDGLNKAIAEKKKSIADLQSKRARAMGGL